MNALFATVELHPFAKVGGLADVAASLPKALRKLGHDVRIVMPRHGTMRAATEDYTPAGRFSIRHGGTEHTGMVLRGESGGVPLYLFDLPAFFDRPRIYGEPDDTARWLAFCDAVLAWLEASDWQPELLHLNEWHTAFIATRLRQHPESPSARLPRLFTIHNLAIHGDFDDAFAAAAGFDARVLASPLAPEPWMTRNAMGQGILWSDAINTVSPTYAREILTPEYGTGLDPLLRARAEHLRGILNGIDDEEFDPARDPRLPARYSRDDLEGKAHCKAALQRRFGLAEEGRHPLAAMVTRLYEQKGADLAVGALEELLPRSPLQFVALGTGEPRYEQALRDLAERYPSRVGVEIGFDADLAQLIYAGSDLFLMPSRFEPCGLGQMIALRYGSVPVVRRTGGLADTVREWTGVESDGNGFLFDAPQPEALAAALERALAAYAQPDRWRALVRRGMSDDYSWRGTAGEYARLYDLAEEIARAGASPARQS